VISHRRTPQWRTQGRRNGGALRGHRPHCPLKGGGGQPGHRCLYITDFISNFMICQDRLETDLLQLFAHTYSWEWFPIIAVISFEVNIVAEHVNAKRMIIMGAILHWTQANSFALVVRQNHGRPQGRETGIFPPSWNLGLRTKLF